MFEELFHPWSFATGQTRFTLSQCKDFAGTQEIAQYLPAMILSITLLL